MHKILVHKLVLLTVSVMTREQVSGRDRGTKVVEGDSEVYRSRECKSEGEREANNNEATHKTS